MKKEIKDCKLDLETYNLIRIRTTELTVKTGKLVTIRDYIKSLVKKDMKEGS